MYFWRSTRQKICHTKSFPSVSKPARSHLPLTIIYLLSGPQNPTVQLTPRATWPYALNISYMVIKNRWGTWRIEKTEKRKILGSVPCYHWWTIKNKILEQLSRSSECILILVLMWYKANHFLGITGNCKLLSHINFIRSISAGKLDFFIFDSITFPLVRNADL